MRAADAKRKKKFVRELKRESRLLLVFKRREFFSGQSLRIVMNNNVTVVQAEQVSNIITLLHKKSQ